METNQSAMSIAQHTPGSHLSDLRKAAHAGYRAAFSEIYTQIKDTRKSSSIVDEFTRGRCVEAQAIVGAMVGVEDSKELREALGEVMRDAIAKATGRAA